MADETSFLIFSIIVLDDLICHLEELPEPPGELDLLLELVPDNLGCAAAAVPGNTTCTTSHSKASWRSPFPDELLPPPDELEPEAEDDAGGAPAEVQFCAIHSLSCFRAVFLYISLSSHRMK